eukprot:scaffold1.g5594.t1
MECPAQDAFDRYSQAVEADPSNAAAWCNRSLAALKLGDAERALADADAALQLLLVERAQEAPARLLARAFHRRAEALAAAGRLLDALRAYRQGLAACGGSAELAAALRVLAERLPPAWLARFWGGVVEAAQAPNPLSSRDGRLIKPVPPELRLPPQQLELRLEAALLRGPVRAGDARDLLCAAWAAGRRPGRAEAALLRGAAYLEAGDAAQAAKDARVALVYCPRLPGGDGGGGGGGAPAWPAAHALQSAALEAQASNTPAAIAAAKACEMDPECWRYAEALERLSRRIPEAHAAALAAGGAAGLEALLAHEAEEATPEFLRQRPKYYYYNQWMRKRIGGQARGGGHAGAGGGAAWRGRGGGEARREAAAPPCKPTALARTCAPRLAPRSAQFPELPEPVVEKLLDMEAGELDLILQYPRATQQTVWGLLGVYEDKGPEFLRSYKVPLLSWEEVKELQAEAAAGAAALPPAAAAPPPALPPAEAAGGAAQSAMELEGLDAAAQERGGGPAAGAAAGARAGMPAPAAADGSGSEAASESCPSEGELGEDEIDDLLELD